MSINTQQLTLQEVIQSWKDRIVCHPPSGEGVNAYIINANTGDRVKYIEANCDSLRHNATNYDRLLLEIKTKHTGIYKEAVLNTIKYETTRRAFKAQHEWIHSSYQGLITQVKTNNFDRQMLFKIDCLNKMVATRDRELKKLKSECKDGLQELQQAYNKLQRQLTQEKKQRQKLGISNKSLGAYKGHFRRAQKKIAVLKTENQDLQKQVNLLEFKARKANY
jgi:chromosome segregation ATPase